MLLICIEKFIRQQMLNLYRKKSGFIFTFSIAKQGGFLFQKSETNMCVYWEVQTRNLCRKVTCCSMSSGWSPTGTLVRPGKSTIVKSRTEKISINLDIVDSKAMKSSSLLGPFWDFKICRFSLLKVRTGWVLWCS